MPPEARADLAVTQVYLTRRSVPDEDPERTLLAWLAERGFHDVLALRSDDSFEVRGLTDSREGRVSRDKSAERASREECSRCCELYTLSAFIRDRK